jgi:hypothetical protein
VSCKGSCDELRDTTATVTTARGVLGQVRPHPPAHAGHARGQAVLIDQPLVDRRHSHPHLQLGADVVPVALDHRPGHLPQPSIDQLREPLHHELAPVGLGHRRPTHLQPGGDRRGQVLAHRLTVHTQTHRQLMLRPPRIPVDQNLHDVDHVEGPPRQRLLHPSFDNEGKACGLSRTKPGTDTHVLPWGNSVTVRWGNYVITNPSRWGNFLIVDRISAPQVHPS